jgi:hypothetical protein
MGTRPIGSAGEVAMIVVSDFTTIDAAMVPKSTAKPPVKFVPVMVTAVPPPSVPELGLTPLTTGGGVVKVKESLDVVALVPNGVITVTSTIPAFSSGDVAVMKLLE